MSNEVINNIETCVIIPMMIAVSSYIIAFLHKQTARLQEQIKNEKAKKLIDIADSIVNQSVVSVTQTYVDGLKAEGAFDKTAQEIAFNKSKEKICCLLTTEVANAVKDNYGSFEDWINTKIEESVCKNK